MSQDLVQEAGASPRKLGQGRSRSFKALVLQAIRQRVSICRTGRGQGRIRRTLDRLRRSRWLRLELLLCREVLGRPVGVEVGRERVGAEKRARTRNIRLDNHCIFLPR